MKKFFPMLACSLFLALTAHAAEPKIKLDLIAKELDKPLYLTHCNTPALYIVEQTGKVRVFENGKLRDKPFLDLTSKVNVDYECGLLGFAFHPEYAKNGYVYVYYTATFPGLKSVLAEYKLAPGSDQIDISTERILLHFNLPFNTHHAGQVTFGSDGMLYIAVGDGGFGNDPFNNAQNGQSYLGKILRIDVNKRDPYGIPKDNPFLDDNSFYPEIWAYGLRNPWRFSFDRETASLLCGDVGQDKWEEINLITKGGNYGWKIKEGPDFLHPVPKAPKTIEPIFKYFHLGTAASVTGGYVYRGKACPTLTGWYVYGDYVDGRIMAFKYANEKASGNATLFTPPTTGTFKPLAVYRPRNMQPGSFGEDADGEIYVCDITMGRVFKISEDKSEEK